MQGHGLNGAKELVCPGISLSPTMPAAVIRRAPLDPVRPGARIDTPNPEESIRQTLKICHPERAKRVEGSAVVSGNLRSDVTSELPTIRDSRCEQQPSPNQKVVILSGVDRVCDQRSRRICGCFFSAVRERRYFRIGHHPLAVPRYRSIIPENCHPERSEGSAFRGYFRVVHYSGTKSHRNVGWL